MSTRAWQPRCAASCPRCAASAVLSTQRNVLAKVPHRLRKRVAREVAAVFRAPGLTESKKRLAEITARWHKELPEAVNVLERGFTAATQFYAFPEPHWARLRTNEQPSSACTPRSSVGSGAPAPSPTEPARSASSLARSLCSEGPPPFTHHRPSMHALVPFEHSGCSRRTLDLSHAGVSPHVDRSAPAAHVTWPAKWLLFCLSFTFFYHRIVHRGSSREA